MDAEDLSSVVGAEIADAISYIDSDIGPMRAMATEYYQGQPLGNEEEGRSQFVSRDVYDTVHQILPSLMRIFFGPERVVEFVPQNAEDVENADQATDYINFIVTRDNPGFEVFYAAFKDALLRKAGFVKWWWDDSEEVSTQEYTGLDDMALAKLLEDLQGAQKAEVVEASETEAGIDCTIRLTRKRDRVVICALPPEEFLIDRRARTIDDATFVAHRCMKSVSDLVAMGYDREEIEAHAQDADELDLSDEATARNPARLTFGVSGSDPATRLVLYIEGYLRVDVDGDGIAELVKVCTIGPSHTLLHWEPVTDRNFAAFMPDPEPHTFFGDCPGEAVMDVQRVKSALWRNTLDSLSLSLNPRTAVIEGQVNMADVMNPEIGAVVRMKRENAVVPLVTPDVSGSAYQALTYMDQIKESRTGMNRVSQGLDPDTLQNMTATASSAQFTQSQQHIELVARIFAETGMQRVFRGILKLIGQNQRQARMVQLRNKWVEIDPRAWRTSMDVTCNVALGGGTNAERKAFLMRLSEVQGQHIQLGSPLADYDKLYNTFGKLLELEGYKNVGSFFNDPTQVQQQPQEAKPDPEMEKVKAQMQLEEMKAAGQLKLQEAKTAGELELAKAKSAAELEQAREMNMLKLQSEREIGAVRLEFERDKAAAELMLKDQEMQLEAQLKAKHADNQTVDGPSMGGKAG